jgi:hypothetical protein
MTTSLWEGVVLWKPGVTLGGEVECDEVYVVAGHKGHPEAVRKKDDLSNPTKAQSRRKVTPGQDVACTNDDQDVKLSSNVRTRHPRTVDDDGMLGGRIADKRGWVRCSSLSMDRAGVAMGSTGVTSSAWDRSPRSA